MKNRRKKIFTFSIISVISFISIFAICNFSSVNSVSDNKSEVYYNNVEQEKNVEEEKFVYLSDLDYIEDNKWSYAGYGSLKKDKNTEDGTISLIVDGAKKIFVKGLGIHATGQVTYDISDLSSKYTRFLAKAGVDSSKGTNGSVTFEVLVSNDGISFVSLYKTGILRGNSEASDINVDISGYKYLRVYVDKSINGNSYDHGVLADAKIVKDDYTKEDTEYTKIHKLEYYDNILNSNTTKDNMNNNYRLILEREFVNKIGYDEIQALVNTYSKYRKTLDWILENDETLEQIIEVGEVNGPSFITTLADLYTQNKEILSSKNGKIYQKMMIGLAATYSTDKVASALQFGHMVASYDYLERFDIYKNMYDTTTLGIYKEAFNNYPMELIRSVMSDGARNDEIKWLNYYTKSKDYNQSVYAYVNHTGTGVGYNDEKYHNEAYKEEYDKKYKLSLYNVPFADAVQRYWMVIDKGGICWNQSRVFQSLFNSIASPTIGSYQPAHEVSFYFIPNSDGTGKWNMANNIFGWGKTATSWYGGNTYRTIFNWGNKSFTDKIISSNTYGNNAGYIYLAQENLNRYDDYKKSLYLNLLANSYTENSKKIETYNLALDNININLDSYDYIINTYKKMDNITSDDWYNLALEIISNYTYYPMAMNDLLKVITPYLDGAKLIDINNKEYNALKIASKATSENVLHDQAAREIANVLLNKIDSEIASFSFDGKNANKIVFNDLYKNYDIAWHYSLDGGITKSEAITKKEYLLTDDEVKNINDTNDILIYIDGLDVNTPSYTIDIVKGEMPTNDGNDDLYANDLENKVIGVTDFMEWRYNNQELWKSYSSEYPDLTGDKKVEVRIKATGNALASEYKTYTFTKDTDTENRKYIPISNLSIEDYSSQADAQKRYATNAIDGNYNTNWHSAWNGSDTKRYIVIKVKNPVYLSSVEYVPGGGGNGKIIDGLIEGSIDGVNWVTLGKSTGLTYTGNQNSYSYGFNNIKNFETDSSVLVQYVKITATKASNGNWFNARMFNLYQDTTNNQKPTADIVYSTKEVTNKDVVATLVNFSSENIKITSEGGNTHTFTQNGTFEFTFVDTFTGKVGSSVATVDWIDKEAPTAQIEYSTTLPTNKSVIATLKPSEEVTVTNNGKLSITDDGKVLDCLGNVMEDYLVDENGNVTDKNGVYVTNMSTFTYEFIQNGEFTFEFVDKAGNKGSKTAKVTWIDTTLPKADLTYDILTPTNKDVTVTLTFDKKVKVTNNNGSNSYIFTKNGEFVFEFVDEAGNTNTATAKVTWIDKEAPTASLKYDKSGKDKAVVSVINPSKEITFENCTGVYEFTKNGTYEIVFYDKLGNKGCVTAIIDWLKDSSDNNNTNTNTNTNINNSTNNNNTLDKVTNDEVKNELSSNNNVTDFKNLIEKENTTNNDIKEDIGNEDLSDNDKNDEVIEDEGNATNSISDTTIGVKQNNYTILIWVIASIVVIIIVVIIIKKKNNN